jgi:hypothetical protein
LPRAEILARPHERPRFVGGDADKPGRIVPAHLGRQIVECPYRSFMLEPGPMRRCPFRCLAKADVPVIHSKQVDMRRFSRIALVAGEHPVGSSVGVLFEQNRRPGSRHLRHAKATVQPIQDFHVELENIGQT